MSLNEKKQPNPKKTGLEAVLEQLKRSDLRLQVRTARTLKNHGWIVKLEHPYQDDGEGRVRKCDIIATKKIDGSAAQVMLFVECKYFPQMPPLVVADKNGEFFNEQDRGKAIKVRDNALLQALKSKPHHYISTQTCVLHGKTNDQNDRGVDRLYEATNQVIKPHLFYRGRESRETVFYPIVVVGGEELYCCDLEILESSREPTAADVRQNRIACLASTYVSENLQKPEYYIVDLVHETALQEYLDKVIDWEISTIVRVMDDKKD